MRAALVFWLFVGIVAGCAGSSEGSPPTTDRSVVDVATGCEADVEDSAHCVGERLSEVDERLAAGVAAHEDQLEEILVANEGQDGAALVEIEQALAGLEGIEETVIDLRTRLCRGSEGASAGGSAYGGFRLRCELALTEATVAQLEGE